ncbi:649_t:CDS:2 [Cetraspora pellucida]|uniref:648_t:CDS:1 n=2 Tax=Cetraspora pellucida TaxID=1433469 RepID=A0ACA9LG56_9GLOM|nr:648_t:CDS:2 [Cetraspora pellucida]CAG8524338.1 649_t:CDS:2 [Cetraspora pellucida]
MSRIISSLIPTERLFVIRGNIKQFINKWSKSHENDWYESSKKFLQKKLLRKLGGEISKNELAELQSPKEANNIGAGLLGVYPITEFVISYIEKSLDKRDTKWKEFLTDADALSDNFNELLGIIKKIDDDSELGKTRTVKNLKKKTEKLLEIYDENKEQEEGYGEIDLEELIEKRTELANDLTQGKTENSSLVKEIVDNSSQERNNYYKVNIESKKSHPNHTEFSLHKDIPYLQITANKVYLANELPFSNYKEGDHLAVDVDRTSLRFSNVEQVARVVKDESAISSSHKKVYNSEEFGDGWVEE